MANILKKTKNVSMDVGKGENLFTAGGNENWCNHHGNQSGGSSKRSTTAFSYTILGHIVKKDTISYVLAASSQGGEKDTGNEISKPKPSCVPPPRPHLLILPKQSHKPRTKQSNI